MEQSTIDILEAEEDIELIHVYPLFGREHVLEGTGCWCHPDIQSERYLVIHNVEN